MNECFERWYEPDSGRWQEIWKCDNSQQPWKVRQGNWILSKLILEVCVCVWICMSAFFCMCKCAYEHVLILYVCVCVRICARDIREQYESELSVIWLLMHQHCQGTLCQTDGLKEQQWENRASMTSAQMPLQSQHFSTRASALWPRLGNTRSVPYLQIIECVGVREQGSVVITVHPDGNSVNFKSMYLTIK